MTQNSTMDTSSVSVRTKVCARCKRELAADKFHRRTVAADGLQRWCKECTSRQRAVAYAERVQRHGKPGVRPYAELWAEGGRRCTRCRDWKSWEDFHRKKTGHNGYSAQCKMCTNRAVASSRRVNLDASRRAERERKDRTGANYKARYGITRDEYEEMARAQGNACAVCGNDEKRLVVDHEHASGKVRKLLCDRCNRDMAVVDDPERLALLTAYRDEHRE